MIFLWPPNEPTMALPGPSLWGIPGEFIKSLGLLDEKKSLVFASLGFRPGTMEGMAGMAGMASNTRTFLHRAEHQSADLDRFGCLRIPNPSVTVAQTESNDNDLRSMNEIWGP